MIKNTKLGVVQCPIRMEFASQWNFQEFWKEGVYKISQFYRYEPKCIYMGEGTRQLYGKYFRQFCDHCTKNEVTDCSLSYCDGKDIKSSCGYPVVCHNHYSVPCSLCNELYDEYGPYIKQCKYCDRMHCNACASDFIHCDEFIEFQQTKEADEMFDILYPILFEHYNFGHDCAGDAVVISILVGYSLGVTVQCSNTIKQCQNEIIYDSQYQVEVGLRTSTEDPYSVIMYQYVPKYVLDEGTHKIYGKNRRIFCDECTQNELTRCDDCLRIREVQPVTTKKWKKYRCHNHRNYAQVTAGLMRDDKK